MSCSVNLVPAGRIWRRHRTKRRNAWVVACAFVALIVAGGWGTLRAADAAVRRLSKDVDVFRTHRQQTQQRLATASAQRASLLGELREAVGARREQPWARRLVDLSEDVPAGVLVTSIEVSPISTRSRPGAYSRRNRPEPREKEGAQAEPSGEAVRVLGYAVDHPALLQLVNVIQDLPAWHRVELVRADQEAVRGANVVAFELYCRIGEEPQ